MVVSMANWPAHQKLGQPCKYFKGSALAIPARFYGTELWVSFWLIPAFPLEREFFILCLAARGESKRGCWIDFRSRLPVYTFLCIISRTCSSIVISMPFIQYDRSSLLLNANSQFRHIGFPSANGGFDNRSNWI